MWGARPVLVVGTWSSDGRANSCAGWGSRHTCLGRRRVFHSQTGEDRKQSVHRQTGSWTRNQCPRGARLLQRHGWRRAPPAQAERVEAGRSADTRTRTRTTLATIPADSGATQTDPAPQPLGTQVRGMEQAQAAGCHRVWRRVKACRSLTRFVGPSRSLAVRIYPGSGDGRVGPWDSLSAGLRLLSTLDPGPEGTSANLPAPRGHRACGLLPRWVKSTLFT